MLYSMMVLSTISLRTWPSRNIMQEPLSRISCPEPSERQMLPGLWIRIRIQFLSWTRIQIQEGNFFKCKKIGKNCKFIQIFKVNLYNIHCFVHFSNLLYILQLKKTLHEVIFTNLFELDPDPHFLSSWFQIHIQKKLLDPDPQKMNAAPQPSLLYTKFQKEGGDKLTWL